MLSAQSVQPTAANNAIPMPPLYRALFHYLDFLDEKAADADAAGNHKQAVDLRGYIGRRASLNAQEEILLRQTAQAHATAVDPIDRRAATIVAAARATFPGGRIPNHDSLPSVPPELGDLTRQRNEVTIASIQTLQISLGTDRFQKLDNWVRSIFVGDSTSKAVLFPSLVKEK
jgi:hypothetical protein